MVERKRPCCYRQNSRQNLSMSKVGVWSLRKRNFLSSATIEYVIVWPPPFGVKTKRHSTELSGRLSRIVSPVQPAANSISNAPDGYRLKKLSV